MKYIFGYIDKCLKDTFTGHSCTYVFIMIIGNSTLSPVWDKFKTNDLPF